MRARGAAAHWLAAAGVVVGGALVWLAPGIALTLAVTALYAASVGQSPVNAALLALAMLLLGLTGLVVAALAIRALPRGRRKRD